MEERIRQIMEKEKLSASKFAEAIGVQRSNISHILSGRNKPSLELINKILDRFQDLNTDWLLLGKGQMTQAPNSSDQDSPSYAFENKSPTKNSQKTPVRIVWFYDDQSFEEFFPNS